MKKRLIPMNGGLAIVLDLPLLAIIGAEGAVELDLTTDGQRLLLQPLADQKREAPARRVSNPASSFDRDNPKETVRIIRELQQRHNFGQEHFRKLHHFGPKASLQSHINYCEGTARFKSETNAIVAERLARCLELRNEGLDWGESIKL